MSFAIRSLCNHHAAEVSGCKLEELSPHVCYIRLRQRIGEQIQKQLEEKLLQDEVKDRDKLQIREMHERMHPEYLKVQTQEGGAAHPQTPLHAQTCSMCSTRIWDGSQFVSLTVSFQAKEEEGGEVG